MKGFRELGEPLFSQGLTARLGLGTRMVAGGVTLYTISGTVYDADGTTPVSGATIALGAYSATSAANGTYTISDVPPDTSGSMTCTKANYLWTAKTISAMSGNLTGQNYTNAWYKAMGVTTAAGAWQAKSMASYAASKVNLANPGTNNLTEPIGAVGWAAATGWAADGTNYLSTGFSLSNVEAAAGTLIVACNNVGTGAVFGCNQGVPATWGFESYVDPADKIRCRWPRDAANVAWTKANPNVLAIAGNLAYLNGTLVATLGSPAAMVGAALLIMFETALIVLASGNIYAAGYFTANLTQPQIAMMGTSMLNL